MSQDEDQAETEAPRPGLRVMHIWTPHGSLCGLVRQRRTKREILQVPACGACVVMADVLAFEVGRIVEEHGAEPEPLAAIGQLALTRWAEEFNMKSLAEWARANEYT